jgi:DNA polymerase-3 subunit delta'
VVSAGLHPWLRAPLQQALATRHAHALLVHGAQDRGPLDFSIALAQAWLCETPRHEREHGLACGRCGGCHLVAERSHPDLRLLVPESLREAAGLPADEAGEGSSKTRKPSREIKVDAVRAALEFVSLTPSRAPLKVLLIHPAEEMNAVAANALLKTLEEPPGPMRFVLGCGAPQALLPTIRSRCQMLALPRPPREPALAWLQAQGLQDAAIVLDACGGEPLRALEQAREGRDAEAWRRFPAQVMQGDSAALAGWPLPVLVEALQRLCEDRLRQALGLPARSFPQLEAPRGAVPAERLIATLTETAAWLRARARHADHPWSAPLAVEALIQRTRAALAARPTSMPSP